MTWGKQKSAVHVKEQTFPAQEKSVEVTGNGSHWSE